MTTLAEFLRARREQLQPADVGLPASTGRRRTPGLRREEVATLAGVSVDYLVRLEQGRDTHPSTSIVLALADALRLSDDESRQLWKLATIGHSRELCPASRSLTRDVPPTVKALLDQLSSPAFVAGPSDDVLAWNDTWERLARPLGLLEGAVPNLARHVFLHPRAGSVYPDWQATADEQVGRLRAAAVQWGDDNDFAALMEELRAVPEFVARWSVFGGADERRGSLRLAHPELGALRFAYEVLLLPGDDAHRLVTWLPDDDATATAIVATVGSAVPESPARLRIIG